MPVDVVLPQLGEKIETIQVSRVLVKTGDTVAVDQPVAELETDKATIEVPSTVAGVVSAVHVAPGDEVHAGQALLTVTPAGAAAAAPESGPAPVPAPAPAAPAVPAPAAPEPAPAAPAPSAEPAAPAAPAPPPAAPAPAPPAAAAPEPPPAAPAPAPPAAAAPEPPAPAAPAAPTPAAPAAPAAEPAPPAAEPAAPAGTTRVPAAPSVRRFARELGVELGTVKGTGPHGRVSREDVMRHVREGRAAAPAAEPAPAAHAGGPVLPPLPDFSQWGPVEREKMTLIRRKTAEHLALSWSVVPHVTIFDKADVTALDALRKRYAPRAEAGGGKLTLAVMVCKVAAAALKVFPRFNASVDMARREIVHKKYVHLGVAVNTDRGLVVPVIRDADRKNMVQLAAEIAQLAEKARQNRIAPEELQGSTFTVTNLGRVGGTFFTPIVNYPEVAILGMGRTALEPGLPEQGGAARTVLPLSLSFDHRVIDGADGARFLGWVIEAIEQPLVLSLEG